ncbi:hypothetical protein NNX13_26340, partial [Pseudomonas sp. Eb3]|uniref:hypothetical protein n=1 Tax=Pseudomonas sp. Eb3 TaxID=1327558 RepID=UPI002104000A
MEIELSGFPQLVVVANAVADVAQLVEEPLQLIHECPVTMGGGTHSRTLGESEAQNAPLHVSWMRLVHQGDDREFGKNRTLSFASSCNQFIVFS